MIGIAAAYFVYVRRPGTSAALIRRLAPDPHASSSTSGTSTSSTTRSSTGPLIAIGRFANDVVERSSSRGSSPRRSDVVRGVGVIVRGAQSGFVRAYALLLIGGFAALGLYFLIVSS